MPTDFQNHLLEEDGSVGEIRTVSTWRVWRCRDRKWSNAPNVVLRNALIGGLHPTTEFYIGEIEKTDTDPNLLGPFQDPDTKDICYLDLASNSRTHGRFTFSPKPIGKRYYGGDRAEQWKRIIYGSILHTGCKKMVYRQMKFIIIDDEHIQEYMGEDGVKFSEPLDDPTNNRHWSSGDSHAKASRRMMELLGIASGDSSDVNPEKPLQFRAALHGKWVAKGTVAYHQGLDSFGADLAIPLSCLKGNKPALGNYEDKILVGLVFEAEERRAKPGWMLFQWFSFETLEADGIISRMIAKCEKLRDAYNSIQQLAEILRIDQTAAEAELEEGSDRLESEAEYENTMIRIIQADKNGLLLLHPYVVRRVKERMQAVWLNLAKAAGVRFYSLMAQPDQRLFSNTEKNFCAPDFEEGEYIVFCNPMRHWGDCQLWNNVRAGDYIDSTGVIAASRELLLSLGRDTDGDFVQLIKSGAYPNMREALANFDPSPDVEKFGKMALQGTLQEIAIRSMNDLTGVVASLLGRARAAGAEQIVLKIPPGGKQTGEKEMRIIDFLSQELQIAVDSLKSAYPNNVPGLDAVKKFLDSIGTEVPWLKDFKDPACYRDRPCAVNPDARDTVSRIVQTVNQYWRAPDLRMDSSPRSYENVLFNDVPHTAEQLQFALTHRNQYRADMAKAIAHKDANEGDTSQIRMVAEATKNSKQSIFETPSPDGTQYPPESWVSAYWKAAHQAETGDAGLVFMIFSDEIVAKLHGVEEQKNKVIIVYAVQHGSWSAPQRTPWRGQEVQIRAYIRDLNGKQYLALEMKWDGASKQIGWFHLGLVGDTYKAFVPPGITKTVKIYSTRFRDGKTTEVTLFDPSMSQQDINDYLNFK